MQAVICFSYHPEHKPQACAVEDYYNSLGYKVDKMPADFLLVPEAECRNEFFKRNPNADYIIFLDSDEIMLADDLHHLVVSFDYTNKDAYRCLITDYIGLDLVSESRVHKPIVAVINRVKHNKKIRFKYNRNVSGCDSYEELPITIHHLGYCLNPEWKIKNYSERKEYHELGQVEAMMGATGIKVKTPKEVKDIMIRLSNLLGESSSLHRDETST